MSSFSDEREPLDLVGINDLAQQMVYRLSGCGDEMIRRALQNAFRDFAKATCCFTTFQHIELENGERSYPISPTIPGMLIDAISEVRHGRKVLENPRHYTIRTFGGAPFVDFTFDIFRSDFCHEPDPEHPVLEREIRRIAEHRRGDHDKEKVCVRCVEIPKIGSEKAPRWFIGKYGDAVVSLALFRLFSMTGKAWSDLAQAQLELVKYENATTNARLNSFSHDGSQFGNSHVDPLDTSTLL